MKNYRNAAIFDVDGTIVRGFIIVELPKHLAKIGMFDKKISNEIKNLFQKFILKKVNAKIVAQRMPILFAKGIKEQNVKKIEKATINYMKKKLKTAYPHTIKLIKIMNQMGMQLIAISGSPEFAIKSLKPLGITEVHGTRFEIIKNKFTGRIDKNLVKSENKDLEFKDIIKNNKLKLNSSYAFGDTEHDLPILERVGHPIAINPNTKLNNIALERGWKIIKNISDVSLLKK